MVEITLKLCLDLTYKTPLKEVNFPIASIDFFSLLAAFLYNFFFIIFCREIYFFGIAESKVEYLERYKMYSFFNVGGGREVETLLVRR